MKKQILHSILHLVIFQISFAQSPILVEDYIAGSDGSIDGRVYQFQNTLTYQGFTESGEAVILQYDRDQDAISVLATDDDFDGVISSLASNSLEVAIFTKDQPEDFRSKNLYRAFEGDLSDIILLHNSGDADLLTFRAHADHYMVVEQYDDIGMPRTNYKVVNNDGEAENFLLGLNGPSSDFRFTAVNRHFIVVPRLEYIDAKSILVYSIDQKSEVPITNLIPDFQDCGLINRVGAINNNLIYYDCEEGTNIYDIARGEFLPTNGLSFFIIYDQPDFIYVAFDGGFYRFIKDTGSLEPIAQNYITIRTHFSNVVFTSEGGNGVNISLLDLTTGEVYTHLTDFPTDINLRFTGFGVVPSGVHLVIYETSENNGVIARINEEEFTIIDSVYNVNFNNRPVAYGDDIYFTHQDPEYGYELFLIDYDVTALEEITAESRIEVSPNPVQDVLKISTTFENIDDIQIVSQTGQILKKAGHQKNIDVSTLPSGHYYIVVRSTDGKLQACTFIKL